MKVNAWRIFFFLLTQNSFLLIWVGVLRSDAFKTLNQYPDDFKFDLIVYDFICGPCLLAFMHKFNYPPMVLATAYTNPSAINHIMGGNHYYSYVPHSMLPFNVDMTFWQRIQNFVLHLQEYVLVSKTLNLHLCSWFLLFHFQNSKVHAIAAVWWVSS